MRVLNFGNHMSKRQQKIRLILFFALTGLLFLSIFPVIAAVEDPLTFRPQVGLPGFENEIVMEENDVSYIAKMIQAFYNYGLSIGGILAAIVLMAGGAIWLTSAGSSDKVSQAKDLIIGSITGLILLFGAWIMLNTINPDLLNFRIATIKLIERVSIVCCEHSGKAETMDSKTCKAKNGTAYEHGEEGIYVSSGGRCQFLTIGCNVKKDCNGKVIWCFDADEKITTKENCGSYLVPELRVMYELKDNRCSQWPECTGKIANCLGVKEGERCEETGTGEELDGYCYFSMCYLGKGEISESCGSEPGAFCSETRCSNLGQAGDKYYADNGDGRKCISSLYCCYKNFE